MNAQTWTAVVSAATPIILAWIAKSLLGLRNDTKRFMSEHLWLLAMAQWTSTSVADIMHHLELPFQPPPEWPKREQRPAAKG